MAAAADESGLTAFFHEMSELGGIVVKETPKLDLDLYIQNYRGRTRLDRLLTIGRCCVPLCVEALKAAVAEAKSGRDVERYREIWECIRIAAPAEPEAVFDQVWADKTTTENRQQTHHLETQLKGYKNNLIKESIRAISLFVNGRYSACLAILNSYLADFLLDIYLQKHVKAVFALIRSKCIVQYVAPFSCVALGSLNEAFAAPGTDIQVELATMIKSGLLQARINTIDQDMAESKTNGKKGKGKASDEDDEDDEEDSDDEDSPDQLEQYVLATFDGERHFQQALDISVGPNEQAWFLVDGHFSVHLTGNYIVDDEEEDEDDEDEEDMYDLASDELLGGEDSDESDELDGLDDPRVMEVDSEDEEASKLVEVKKGKNKRAAEEAEGLDDLITKDDAKLSKKQQKKLKNNKGEAVESEEPKSKADKKVQFAKNLEQGPTGSEKKGKAAVGVKVVQGVTIDDRKIGEGRAVKNGDTVGVRYIGKLENGKVFDANKKGKPFSFKAGKNQVIKGWDIGILGMTIGGERRLTIPAHLAYGSKGLPGIPANSTLQFDVKLLEIK
ncbi:FK506-binding protein 4 like [Verticillium longisporum]|nr:FK506-binding protein 4 like [Verticillium longisporum]